MKKIIINQIAAVLTLIVSINGVKAQDDPEEGKKFTFSGYTDVYFAIFSDSLAPNALQKVATVSPRSHRFGVNIAQLGVHYQAEKIRGNLILAYGDIAKATWDPDFPMLQEANVGIRLAKGWWLDGGFFTTHIGTEGFLPKDNYTSTTAVATYNEPFYQSGVRLSYEGSETFSAEFWVVSGYNFFLDANDAKSVGLLLSYAPSETFSLTYTNLLGRESLDGVAPKQFRTYQNLYANWQPLDKLFLIAGGDVGTQTHSKLQSEDEGQVAIMYNALTTLRYQFTPQYSVTGRAEVFNDEHGFISGTYTNKAGREEGLRLYGLTVSTEYKPTEKSYVRLEGRYIQAKDELEIFYDGSSTNQRVEGMVTMGFEF